MNNKNLNNLSKKIYKFICEYRNYSKWYFYDKEISNLKDLKAILNNEDKGIDFMDDLSDMFRHFTTQKDFSKEKEEKFYDDLCSIFKEYNQYLNGYDKHYDIETLAKNLVDYSKEFDPYEFNDCFDSYEDAFNHTKKDLLYSERVKSMIEMLGMDIIDLASEKGLDDPEMSRLSNKAFKLINQLSIHCLELQKINQKDKDMDM